VSPPAVFGSAASSPQLLTVGAIGRSLVWRGWIAARGNDVGCSRHNREDQMPTVIAHHTITKGTKHWLESPRRDAFFKTIGVNNVRTFVDPQNPNHVAVLMDVPDMDAMVKALQTKEAADAMDNDGVVPDSVVVLVEAKR